MNTIRGVVESMSSRPGQYGLMHSVKVNNVQYGTKGQQAPVREGDYVEFTAVQNAKGYWDADAKSFKKVEAPASGDAKPSPAVAAKAWVPDKDRQAAITYQSSRKDALEFVGMLIANGALDLGKAKTGAAKIEMVEMYVDKYTQRFVDDVNRGTPPEHPIEDAKVSKTKTAPTTEFVDDELPF